MNPGDLVKVTAGAAELDGLVFDTPNSAKAVVAIVDPARGPVLRTVDQKALTIRASEGPHDRALRLLVKRTPPPVHGAARGGTSGGHGRSGHTRGAAHRTTGR